MTALPHYRREARRNIADEAVARLPESTFGHTEWVTMTARTCAEHLGCAIVSGQPYRVANAIRSMAHTPNLEHVALLANAICDTLISDGYATHDTETIANVTNAREIVAMAISELRAGTTPASPDLSLLREMVSGYVRLVGLHDPHMSERLDAVGTFAGRLARSMKLPAATVLDVELAGRLHDVGMIGVPRPTRAKIVALSRKEHDHLKRHPVAGASFVGSIPSLAHLAPIVRSHHERFDGHGYPDGLRGDEIPLASRIISVAGAFVDFISASSHLGTMLPHDACRELALRAGTEFDPDVVSATLHLLRFRQRTNRSA